MPRIVEGRQLPRQGARRRLVGARRDGVLQGLMGPRVVYSAQKRSKPALLGAGMRRRRSRGVGLSTEWIARASHFAQDGRAQSAPE